MTTSVINAPAVITSDTVGTRPVVYIDLETTCLNPVRRRAWEIAMVRDDGEEIVIWIADLDLSDSNERSLGVGRFYDRHPLYRSGAAGTMPRRWPHDLDDFDQRGLLSERAAADVVERFTRGAVFAGIVPSFDAATLDAMLRRYGLAPAWHYSLLDVSTLAAGWLLGRAAADGAPSAVPAPRTAEEISIACGVAVPGAEERHTALGDAKWAQRLHEHVLRARCSR